MHAGHAGPGGQDQGCVLGGRAGAATACRRHPVRVCGRKRRLSALTKRCPHPLPLLQRSTWWRAWGWWTSCSRWARSSRRRSSSRRSSRCAALAPGDGIASTNLLWRDAAGVRPACCGRAGAPGGVVAETSPHTLAPACGLPQVVPGNLERILRLAGQIGLLKEDEGGRWSATQLSRVLAVRAQPLHQPGSRGSPAELTLLPLCLVRASSVLLCSGGPPLAVQVHGHHVVSDQRQRVSIDDVRAPCNS